MNYVVEILYEKEENLSEGPKTKKIRLKLKEHERQDDQWSSTLLLGESDFEKKKTWDMYFGS